MNKQIWPLFQFFNLHFKTNSPNKKRQRKKKKRQNSKMEYIDTSFYMFMS